MPVQAERETPGDDAGRRVPARGIKRFALGVETAARLFCPPPRPNMTQFFFPSLFLLTEMSAASQEWRQKKRTAVVHLFPSED